MLPASLLRRTYSMANNKMLIDASHREETRVVVLRGNRIEEFDFEAQERRQLRGNIYLAKVTRVEPSLQAAFIDYGGNRHGFLAFSEIHPDYYQIPEADRKALLQAEAQDAVADAASDDGDIEDTQATTTETSNTEDSNAEASTATSNDDLPTQADASQEDDGEAVAEEKPKKRRRRSRRKPKADATLEASPEEGTAPVEAAPDETASSETSVEEKVAQSPKDSDADNNNDGGSTTMAAMVEMDSISEPAPEDENNDNSDDASSEPALEEAAEEKPKKRRTTRRTTRKKKVEEEAPLEEATTEEVEVKEVPAETASEDTSKETVEEKPKKRTTRRRKKKTDDEVVEANATQPESAPEAVAETSDAPVSEEKSEADATDTSDADKTTQEASTDIPKPARKRSRRGRKSKSAPAQEDATTDENGSPVENAGQEDAMEEVPVRRKSRRQYKIQEVIRRRQVLLVQVVKEERGNKGAALTTYLSLAGRYSVLMPNTARGGGISRKITNASDRKRLKEIATGLDVPAGMGVILRTAGASRTDVEITRDFEYLMRLWENVRNLTLESSAPYLVYEEGSLIKRSIRDLFNKDIGEVIVSGEDGFNEAKQFMQMLEPGQTKNVKLYRGEAPILSRYGVESQLDKMLATEVTLKSGGYLVINQTEALVAVDVNSGRSTREHSIEATAVQTNLEAAEEVARQLKLRDLAGLVVIDFIDMEEKRNNRAVEKRMKECLKNDRARIQVGHISHFGLMEMSRQRMRASVLESTMEVCPHCQGIGHVRSPSSYSIHIMRALEDHLNRNSRNDLTLKVARNAALYILNHHRSALNELEERFGVKIIVEIDTSVEGQSHTIEKGALSTTEPKQRAVVNPMDFGDETIVDGSEPAVAIPATPAPASAPAPTSNDDDEENGNKKRRRRRRGGRGRGRDKDQTAEEGNSQEASTENLDADSNANESQPVTTAETSEAKPVVETAVETATQTIDEAPAKPKRGRRKKAPIAAKAEENVEESAVKPEAVEAKDEAPKKPRRATGRPGRKEKSEDNASQDTEQTSSEATPTQVEVEKTEVKAEAVSETSKANSATKEKAPKKTKRSTGRPGRKSKADIAEEGTSKDTIAEPETGEPVVEADDKPAKPKKRTTRRVKAEAIEDDSSSEDAGDKKKKKGWIKGFFS